MRYADIILPQAGPPFYTYSVGSEPGEALRTGCAVAVQFGVGGNKIIGGIVREVHDRRPAFATKPVKSLLFDEPIVSPAQIRLWDWMADYYACSPGEVMLAALPTLLKPAGFSEEEFAADQFRARRVRCVALAGEAAAGPESLSEVCERLRTKAPRQYSALVEVAGACSGSGAGTCGGLAGADSGAGGPAPRSVLQSDAASLTALAKKGLITFSELEQNSSLITLHAPLFTFPLLSPAQQSALDELRVALRGDKNKSPSAFRPALLFGPPASGKSEVYFHAAAGALAGGRDVLLLMPEIALTTQFKGRVQRLFGDRVEVYHSGLSDRRRAETYIRLARSIGPKLVVGARSAIFLPLKNLGLVIVDEEQDPGFKQSDPAPRYNARDAAIVLASICGADTILASATPSLETWANALGGKYGMAQITERWGGSAPPAVTISDTRRAARRWERKSHFNKELIDAMREALERGEQVILFQNRRGLAPFVECTDCGHIPRCGHCAIPLSLHRDSLRCHYCGAVLPIPAVCPSCGGANLDKKGFGTEKIEQELARLFPEARVARLDRDSASSERAYSRILGDFEARATDILVGTQMVTKGLDFAGVSLVGILNADNLSAHPDFRASERAFSLMMQVAGRAGRTGGGRVVIQTAAPDNRLITRAAAGDFRAMAAELLAERAAYLYPPYSRLVEITVRHADRQVLHSAAARLAGALLPAFGDRMQGPQPPLVEKIKGEFALVFLLKIPRTDSMAAVRRTLRAATTDLRPATVTINVDPL